MGQIITLRRNRLSVQKAVKIGTVTENISVFHEQKLKNRT